MEKHIGTTSLHKIRPVFANIGENVRRYQQVRSLFEESGAHRIFSKPITGGAQGTEIDWFTEYQVGVHRLPEGEPDPETAQRLKYQVNRLYRDLVRFAKTSTGKTDLVAYEKLSQTIDSCLEIPGWSSVCLTENGQFVLLNWGFVEEKFNAARGLLKKLFPTRVTPITIALRFKDNKQAAPLETVQIHWTDPLGVYPEFKTTLTSDHQGLIALDDVPFFAELTISHDSENRAPIGKFQIDERLPEQHYEILIERAVYNMRFRVVLDTDNTQPLHDIPVCFEYADGRTDTRRSGADGRIVLPDIAAGTSIRCFSMQDGAPSHHHQFVSTPHPQEFLICLPAPVLVPETEPDDASMVFKVIRPDGTPATSARLSITINDTPRELTTGEDGCAAISNVHPATIVRVSATEGRAYADEVFTREPGIPYYEIRLKHKRGCAWWWLLLLLVTAVLVYYFINRNQPPSGNAEATPPAKEQVIVKIRVVDEFSGAPIQGAEVSINGETGQLTDTAGWVTTRSFDTGTRLKITVSKSGYGEKSPVETATPGAEFIIPLKSYTHGGLPGKRGDLSVTLSWEGADDLDLHCIDPMGTEIYFGKKDTIIGRYSLELDVDANNNENDLMTPPQENIVCYNPIPGEYEFYVLYFEKRTSVRVRNFKVTVSENGAEEVLSGQISREKENVLMKKITVPGY